MKEQRDFELAIVFNNSPLIRIKDLEEIKYEKSSL